MLARHVPLQIGEGPRAARTDASPDAVFDSGNDAAGSRETAFGFFADAPLPSDLIILVSKPLCELVALAAQLLLLSLALDKVLCVPVSAKERNAGGVFGRSIQVLR